MILFLAHLIHHNARPNAKSRIVCVLETRFADGYTNLVNLKTGLTITEWHPIFYQGKWTFPVDVQVATNQPCSAVYSLILDSNHIVFINNMPCICLGHNYNTSILKHGYFGSGAVVDDLKEMPGWDKGKIITSAGCMSYSPKTQQASKIMYINPNPMAEMLAAI